MLRNCGSSRLTGAGSTPVATQNLVSEDRPPERARPLALVAFAASASGQNAASEASTVSPQAIFDLSEDDFKLWISGRQPKAWEGEASSSGTTTTPASTPRTTTPASVFRTTSTSTTPAPPSFLTTTTSTTTTTSPFDSFPPSDGKSWFEEEEGDTATPRPDVLGEQFKPAGEDFAQWLERQMNRVQEVTFVPQTTLTGDQLPGAGLVTRLTTNRNRIPATTFQPVTDYVPVTTTPPPPPPPPSPSAHQTSAPAYLPVEQ
uniref:Uncharacterized protein n=1 Tax=Anopheles melas TaxID=34690 RepID=A0A182TW91_9DIPT